MKSKVLKINLAILICSMFIFRILIINIGVCFSQNNKACTYHTIALSHKTSLAFSSTSKKSEYSITEVFEETNDNDDKLKVKLFNAYLFSTKNNSRLNNNPISNSKYQSRLFVSNTSYITNRVFRI